MLANDMHTRYWNGLKYQAVTSWKNGIIRYPTNMATPLKGSSQVPTLIPQYQTKPGPANVVIDLLMSPIRTTMPMIMGLLMAKSQYILLPKSSILRRRIVKATPLRSPKQPQIKAPPMATTLQIMLQQLRKWSSLIMGMQMILKFIIRYISYKPVRKDIIIMIKKRSSLTAFSNGSTYYCVFRFYFYYSPAGIDLQYCSSIYISIQSFFYFSLLLQVFLFIKILPNMARNPVIAKPIIAVFLTFLVTSMLKKWISSFVFQVVYLFQGFIICINSKFHAMLPTPKAITRTAVILFLEFGN